VSELQAAGNIAERDVPLRSRPARPSRHMWGSIPGRVGTSSNTTDNCWSPSCRRTMTES